MTPTSKLYTAYRVEARPADPGFMSYTVERGLANIVQESFTVAVYKPGDAVGVHAVGAAMVHAVGAAMDRAGAACRRLNKLRAAADRGDPQAMRSIIAIESAGEQKHLVAPGVDTEVAIAADAAEFKKRLSK